MMTFNPQRKLTFVDVRQIKSNEDILIMPFYFNAREWINQFDGELHQRLVETLNKAIEDTQSKSASYSIGYACGAMEQVYFNIVGKYPE